MLLNPNPVTTSPGSLNASFFGTGVPPGTNVVVTIGDASTPQQLRTVTIYCQ
jgi:hypothetical protein